MKLRPLLSHGLFVLATVCFLGGEPLAAAPVKTPLGANEARVKGHKTPLAYSVLLTPASKRQEADWKNELILPAGPTQLAVRYKTVTGGGAVGAASEYLNVVEIAFEAEAGHEYYAEMWGMSIFNMGYKITDKTTGKVVGQAKVKDQKKAEKERAKPGS